MITQLPVEIQEIIYNKLHVKDRVMLLASKKFDFKPKPKANEKKLGVLSKAIAKRKVTKLSEPITRFIGSCSSSDPTIQEMSKP